MSHVSTYNVHDFALHSLPVYSGKAGISLLVVVDRGQNIEQQQLVYTIRVVKAETMSDALIRKGEAFRGISKGWRCNQTASATLTAPRSCPTSENLLPFNSGSIWSSTSTTSLAISRFE